MYEFKILSLSISIHNFRSFMTFFRLAALVVLCSKIYTSDPKISKSLKALFGQRWGKQMRKLLNFLYAGVLHQKRERKQRRESHLYFAREWLRRIEVIASSWESSLGDQWNFSPVLSHPDFSAPLCLSSSISFRFSSLFSLRCFTKKVPDAAF